MQQKEINLLEFQNKFPTEKSCLKHLNKIRWPNGFQCPRCGHDQASYHSTRHLFQCKSCRYQVSLTAGTIFHKTRTSLRKWFWMILFLGRYKSGISIRSFQKLLNINDYKTAWMMAHKIRHAMAARDANYQLAGLIEIDDSYFGGSKPGKRGRGAGGKAKVVLAIENCDDHAGFAKASLVSEIDRDSIAKAFGSHISKRAAIRSDGWRAYGVLKSDTIAHEVVSGSGQNGSINLPWVHLLISNIKGGIRGVYRGVSTKYLDLYLSEFCYRHNRRYWESQLFDRLLDACTHSKTVTYAELSQ